MCDGAPARTSGYLPIGYAHDTLEQRRPRYATAHASLLNEPQGVDVSDLNRDKEINRLGVSSKDAAQLIDKVSEVEQQRVKEMATQVLQSQPLPAIRALVMPQLILLHLGASSSPTRQ